MSRVVPQKQQDPKEKLKSIEQLEKELYTEYKGYKESSNKIKKIIEDNKNIKIDIRKLNFKEYEQFKESFTKIKEKINFIDELINDLKKLSKDEISTSIDNINPIKKHMDYLEHLKKYLKQKLQKMLKIIYLMLL